MFLKFPFKAGDTWTDERELSAGEMFTRTCTVGGEEEIEVPAGKFKTVVVHSKTKTGRFTQRDTEWFAPGVGRVKYVPPNGTRGEVTTVLKSFAPGK